MDKIVSNSDTCMKKIKQRVGQTESRGDESRNGNKQVFGKGCPEEKIYELRLGR